MLWLLLAELVMLPCTFVGHFLIHSIVPMRHPTLFSLLACFTSGIIWAVNHFLLPQFSLAFGLLIFLTDLILIFCFLPHGKRGLAILTYALLSIIQLITSSITLTLFPKLIDMDLAAIIVPTQPMYPIGCFVTSLLASLLMYLFIRLFKRILPPIRENHILLAFASLFFSQILLLYLVAHFFVYGKSLLGLGFTYVVTLVIYLIAGMAFLRGYRTMRHTDLAELRSQQAEQQLQMQVSHYEQLRNDILHINQIRHDLSNQLQAAYYLLEQGESEQVRRQLDLLNDQICNKVGPTYCANLIVDAILSGKAKLCKEHHIPFQFSVFLPQELPIETAHLCSIFSNILDNGISATLKTPPPYGEIELSADVHSEFVSIQCSNPSLPVLRSSRKSAPLRSHGLGLDILRSIAEIYDGTMQTAFEHGRFSVTLLLHIPQKKGQT